MYKNILLFVYLLCAFSSFSQTIKGKVVDANTQVGIPFAKVSLVDYVAGVLTDEHGNFTVKGKYADAIQLRISASGYEILTKEYEPSSFIQIALEPIYMDFDEVTVSASSNELKRNTVSYIELKSVKELNEIPKVSVGNMLEKIPGVYNSATGLGISKPVIRGLQGVRVLTLLNGVRMEGQQWGGDHGMGVSELGIASVEVMKGPASLLYGADALGGVIYLSNELYGNQGEHAIDISSHFESATLGTVNQLMYKGSTKNVKFIAGGRLASHADYQIPNGQFVKNSRFLDNNLKFGMGWHRKRWVGNVRYDFAQSTIGIPGHTHDSIATTADFLSDGQVRKKTMPVQYLTNHIASWENKWLLKKHTLQLLTSFTLNELVEHDEKVTIPALWMNTYNLPYKFNIETRLKHGVVLKYGVQGMFLSQINQPKAERRLVPNAQQWDNGLYFLTGWTKDKWRLLGGVRADMRMIQSKTDQKFLESYSKIFAGYNFSAGASYEPSKKHLFRLNVSSGFRTPHLSELLSDGIHHGTFRYEVGNRNLVTEKAFQVDFSYEFTGEHLSIIANPFVNQIADFIYLEPKADLIDGLKVFHYKQSVEQVTQVGGDLGLHWHPHFAHILHLESTMSYLTMLSKEENTFSLIPQPRWTNSIIARLNMKSKFRVDNIVLQYAYYLPQNTVSQFESTSVDYGVLDLGTQLSLNGKIPLKLQLGVRNLTNTAYINHLSRLKNIGLQSVGRSYYVKLIIQLNFKKDEKEPND